MSLNDSSIAQLRIDRSGANQRSTWARNVGIVLVLILAAAFVVWKALTRPMLVDTATVAAIAQNAPDSVLNASGYVTARREATVSAKMTGQIVDVLFDEGQKVVPGQVLAHLDPADLNRNLLMAQSQLDVSQATLSETIAQLQQAESEFARQSILASNHLVSPSDFDKARADALTLRARLARQKVEVVVAQREVGTWEQQIDNTVIRAPFAGVIVSKAAQPGEMISPLSAGGAFTRTGICTIVDMASLEIEVDVNENYINRVVPGQPVDAVLDAYPDWHIPSKVIAIIPTADRQKGTVKVRIGFNQLDPRILPDMGVKVSFQSTGPQTRTPAASVSADAIQTDGDQDVVWAVHDGHVERRAVKIGERQTDTVTVEAGLTAGETVVLHPPPGLKDGDAVRTNQP
jgi:RND family efflux transporter MFP subunit